MRLWHQQLIHYLPNKQLLEQHSDCCALRGNAWNSEECAVKYVFAHPYSWLFYYHYLVIHEMRFRGHCPDVNWSIENYRGLLLKFIDPQDSFVLQDFNWKCLPSKFKWFWQASGEKNLEEKHEMIYPEHDNQYLDNCLEDLSNRNVELVNGVSISKMKMQIAIETGL